MWRKGEPLYSIYRNINQNIKIKCHMIQQYDYGVYITKDVKSVDKIATFLCLLQQSSQ